MCYVTTCLDQAMQNANEENQKHDLSVTVTTCLKQAMQMRNAGVDKLSATEDHITSLLILERYIIEINFYSTL